MKLKRIVVILALVLLSNFAYPQAEWVRGFGGTERDRAFAIASDDEGNVYSTGWFQNEVDFNSDAGTDLWEANGEEDVFIQKLDANGNFVWAKAIGGTGRDEGWTVAVDEEQNVYISGAYQGTVDFDPGAGEFNMTSVNAYEVFILKLSPDGDFIWAKELNGPHVFNRTQALESDKDGHIILTGQIEGPVDFDPGIEEYEIDVELGEGVFALKLTTSGEFVWAKVMQGEANADGYGIDIDPSGNVYLAGSFQGIMDFDPGVDELIIESTVEYERDIYIQKLSSDGDLVWVKRIGGDQGDVARDVTIGEDGNVYVTGYFSGEVDFDPGVGEVLLNEGEDFTLENHFILKLTENGELIWVKYVDGESAANWGYGIETDSDGNVYTIGHFFGGLMDFDPGIGVCNLDSGGGAGSNVFILKLDEAGDFVGVRGFGSENVQSLGLSLTKDVDGNMLATGAMGNDIIGDGIEFVLQDGPVVFTSQGEEDVFVLKVNIFTCKFSNISEFDGQMSVNVFPNPTNDIIQILTTGTEEIFIEIYNSLGELVLSHDYEGNSVNVSLDQYPVGIYYLKIKSGDSSIERKIIKQ